MGPLESREWGAEAEGGMVGGDSGGEAVDGT